VDTDSRVISANGSAHSSLYAVGSLTRGTRWEITAIPELREQANGVVRKFLHDHAERPALEVTIPGWAAGLQFQTTSVTR